MSRSGIDALAAAQRELARRVSALEAEDTAGVESWLRGDRGVSAAERLGVYAHAYFARIHGALREDFAALCWAIGEPGFSDLVRLYLIAHPPNSHSLRFAGARLPGFLAAPVAEAFARRWPFAADLAALEWARVDAFDAPDAPALSRESLARIAPEDWGGLRFALVDSTRTLRLDWPVHVLYRAFEQGQSAPEVRRAPTALLVYRTGERVLHRPVSAPESAGLEAIASGREFAELCERVETVHGAGNAASLTASLLERWLADGLLVQLSG